MQVSLRPRVIHMYSEYSGKLKKILIKYNMIISILLSIQYPCGTKLTLDGVDRWRSSLVIKISGESGTMYIIMT